MRVRLSKKAVLLALVIVISIGTAGCAAQAKDDTGTGTSATAERTPELPNFAYNSATSLAAYKLAPGLAEILPSLPCYCECGKASNHKSLKDCFFKEDDSFNDHASNCDICQDEVIDIDQWQREGKSLRDIRAAVDEKYRSYGRPTDTPMVP